VGKHLGELGTPKRKGDTFGWFGNTVRVGEGFSDLRLIDFLDEAGDIPDTDQLGQMKALKGFLHSIVHPDDWEIFWQACLGNGQGVEDLMVLVSKLTEFKTARPTKRRSDSSDGRRATKGSSKRGSSSQVIRRLEKRGRPDLALIVQQADDARSTG
jgi:hypothetical protein